MPSPSRKQLTAREQVDTGSIENSKLNVTAQILDNGKPSNAAVLADSLRDFMPTASAYAQRHVKEQTEQDQLDAAGFYASQGADAPLSEADIPDGMFEGKSEAFRRAYMGLVADQANINTTKDFLTEYQDLDEDIKLDNDRFNDWVRERVQSRVAGIDDPVMLKSTLEHLSRAEKSVHEVRQKETLREIHDTKMSAAADVSLDKFNNNQLNTPDLLNAELKRMTDSGIADDDAKKIILTAAQSASVNGGGRPELFDVFYKNYSDGSPSMHDDPKYTAQIDQWKQQAENAKEDRLNRAKAERNWDYQDHLKDKLRNGMLTEADIDEARADGIDQGFLTGIRDRLLSYQKEERDFRKVRYNFEQGVLSGTPAQQKRAWSEHVKREQERDPERWINKVVEHGVELGQMYPAWKDQLNSSNPQSANFESTAELYAMLKSVNAQHLESNLTDSQSFLLGTYNDLTTTGQMSPEQAKQVLADTLTPEAMAQARRAVPLSDNGLLKQRVRSEIITEGNMIVGLGEAQENEAYVEERVQKIASTYIALGRGNVSQEQAIDRAIERFKSSHGRVGGRWVDIQSSGLHHGQLPALNEVADKFIQQFTEKRISQDLPIPEGGYFIAPDPATMVSSERTWGVYDSRGMPVTRVSPHKLLEIDEKLKRDEAIQDLRDRIEGREELKKRNQQRGPRKPVDTPDSGGQLFRSRQ